MRTTLAAVGVALASLVPAFGRAQLTNLSIGVGGLEAAPTGGWGSVRSAGFGGNASIQYAMPHISWLALRAEFTDVVSASRTATVGYYGDLEYNGLSAVYPELDSHETNTSSVIAFAVGPELSVPIGLCRIYANAFSGAAGVRVSSTLVGLGFNEMGFIASAHSSPTNFLWGGGGGLIVPLAGRHLPLSLEGGVRYWDAGSAGYLITPPTVPPVGIERIPPTTYRRATFVAPIVGVVAHF